MKSPPLDRWPASATVDHLVVAHEALDLALRTLGIARQAVFDALANTEPAAEDELRHQANRKEADT